MPPPAGMSAEEYAKPKAKQAGGSSSSSSKKDPEKEKAAAAAKEAAEAKKKYLKAADPATVEDLVGVDALQEDFFEEGMWKPAWSNVEFDGDACLKNISDAGKAKDGFFAPAGTILPLGAAFPEMTIVKYGGYFPAGTSFPGGVLIPLHARMVNILSQETTVPKKPAEESLCIVQ